MSAFESAWADTEGGVPAAALEEVQEQVPPAADSAVPAGNCVLARVIDADACQEVESVLEGAAQESIPVPDILVAEPVAAASDDVYLLVYDDAQQAQDAVERLREQVTSVELDAMVSSAAEAGEGEANPVSYTAGMTPIERVAELTAEEPADDGLLDELAIRLEQNADEVAVVPGEAETSDSEDTADDASDVGAPVDTGVSGDAVDTSDAGEVDTANAEEEPEETLDGVTAQFDGEDVEEPVMAAVEGEQKPEPVKVALVDSGAPRDAEQLLPGVSMFGEDVSDTAGHASEVAGAILSQGRHVEVLPVKVLDENGHGTVSSVYAGIEYAIAEHVDIINLSLYAKRNESSALIDEAVTHARNEGIVVVAAAGNDNADAGFYVPASSEGALTVGSCDAEGRKVESSNFGERVDIWAKSPKTSIGAGLATGWLAENSNLDTPLSDLLGEVGMGVFFDKLNTPDSPESEEGQGEEAAHDGAEEQSDENVSAAEDGADSVDSVSNDEVQAAGMTVTTTEAPLRASSNRLSSVIPRTTIWWKTATHDVTNATFDNSHGSSFKKKSSKLVSDGVQTNLSINRIAVANKTAYGSSWDVPGYYTLTWKNAATDSDGNDIDVTVKISDVHIKHNNYAATQEKWVYLASDWCSVTGGGKHYRTGDFELQSFTPYENAWAPVSTKMKVTVTLKYSNRTGTPSGNMALGFDDIDQPDKTSGIPVSYSGTYMESVELVSGFQKKTYIESTGSELDINRSTGKFTAKRDWDANSYPYTTGFVAVTSAPTFSFIWRGSDCGTRILTTYEGVRIRDKNTSGTNKDQGVVKKTVDSLGANDTGGVPGHARTSTSWRTTNMPWKGEAVYAISAKPGYRVTKVNLVFGGQDHILTSNGEPVKTITFGGKTYPTTRDYDIIVTTARVADASVAPQVSKSLSGRALAANEFSFELKKEKTATSTSGSVLQTKKNAANGNVTFDALTFTYDDDNSYPLTYYYSISEKKGSLRNITYDSSVKHLKVVVNYNTSTHKLSASATFINNDNTFINTFKPTGGVKIKKVAQGSLTPLSGAQFGVYSVTTTQGLTYQAVKAMTPLITVTTGSDGIATVPNTQLPASNNSYAVIELSAPAGYYLNTTDVGVFTLTADAQVNTSMVTTPFQDGPKPASASLHAQKFVSGHDLVGGEYTFNLKSGGLVIQTATNDASGEVRFEDIVYTSSDVDKIFHYVIEEVPGTDSQTDYDDSWWSVDVSVYNGSSSIKANPVIYKQHAASEPQPNQASEPMFPNAIATPTAASSSYALTINYYANNATGDRYLKWTGASPMYSSSHTYGAGSNTLANYSSPTGSSATWHLYRNGYRPTGFWIVGSSSGTVKVHEDMMYASPQELAAKLGQNLSTGNVTLNLYAEWVPTSTLVYAPGIPWFDNPTIDYDYASVRAIFYNSREKRCGASVRKLDSETQEPLAGASFRITGVDADAYIYTQDGLSTLPYIDIVTDENGVASTPPSSWPCAHSQVSAPFTMNYCLGEGADCGCEDEQTVVACCNCGKIKVVSCDSVCQECGETLADWEPYLNKWYDPNEYIPGLGDLSDLTSAPQYQVAIATPCNHSNVSEPFTMDYCLGVEEMNCGCEGDQQTVVVCRNCGKVKVLSCDSVCEDCGEAISDWNPYLNIWYNPDATISGLGRLSALKNFPEYQAAYWRSGSTVHTTSKTLVIGKQYKITEISPPQGYSIDDATDHVFVAGLVTAQNAELPQYDETVISTPAQGNVGVSATAQTVTETSISAKNFYKTGSFKIRVKGIKNGSDATVTVNLTNSMMASNSLNSTTDRSKFESANARTNPPTAATTFTATLSGDTGYIAFAGGETTQTINARHIMWNMLGVRGYATSNSYITLALKVKMPAGVRGKTWAGPSTAGLHVSASSIWVQPRRQNAAYTSPTVTGSVATTDPLTSIEQYVNSGLSETSNYLGNRDNAEGGTWRNLFVTTRRHTTGITYWTDADDSSKYYRLSGATLELGTAYNQYSIKYEGMQDATFGASHPTSATYNTPFTVDIPQKPGHIFNGWTISGLDSASTHTYGSQTTMDTVIENSLATNYLNLSAVDASTVVFKANWIADPDYLEDGAVEELGTWYDTPLRVATAIRVAKDFQEKTGRTTTQSKTVEADTLAFGLYDAQGNLIEEKSNTEGIGAVGAQTYDRVEFTPITYTYADVGQTFVYRVRELNTGLDNVKYDDSEYEVSVAVSMNNGKLVAEQTMTRFAADGTEMESHEGSGSTSDELRSEEGWAYAVYQITQAEVATYKVIEYVFDYNTDEEYETVHGTFSSLADAIALANSMTSAGTFNESNLGQQVDYGSTAEMERTLRIAKLVTTPERGTLTFFRSETVYSSGGPQTVTDLNSNSYYGIVYTGIENTTASRGGVPWNAKRANITAVSVADRQKISPTSMGYWFADCTNLTSIDLSGVDTAHVTNMTSLFYYCTQLASLDLTGFDTSNVTNMNSMFFRCMLLTTLDLSNFVIAPGTSVAYMFSTCLNLTTIYASSNWDTLVSQTNSMFSGCFNLVGGEGTICSGLNETSGSAYARIDDASGNSGGYFTFKARGGTVDFVNVYTPSFDIELSKSGLNGNAALPASSVAGAEFDIYEWDTNTSVNGAVEYPTVFGNRALFDAAFQYEERSQSYEGDADILVTYGLSKVASIAVDATGQARTEDQPLVCGKVYFVIESKAPPGFWIDGRDSGGEVPVHIAMVPDYASSGAYAVLDSNWQAAGGTPGEPIVTVNKANMLTLGSNGATSSAGAMSWTDRKDSNPRGGISVLKVDADDNTEHLPGAVFAIYGESEFEDSYDDWVDAAAGTDEEFILALQDIDSEYYVESYAFMSSGDNGVASTTASALPANGMRYRVVEIAAPEDYALPAYDFSQPNNDDTGNYIVQLSQANVLKSVAVNGSNIVFANDYMDKTGTAQITATKSYQAPGSSLVAGQFSFELLDSDGNHVETVSNAADGSISFTPFSYSNGDEGTYSYKVREIIPQAATSVFEVNGENETIAYANASDAQKEEEGHVWELAYQQSGVDMLDEYDGTVWDVTVTVSDSMGEAQFATSVSVDGAAQAVFNNTKQVLTPAAGYGTLKVMKTDENSHEGLAGATFEIVSSTFGDVWTIESDENGLAQTPAGELPINDTYTVRELEAPPGYELNEDWERTFTLTTNGQVVDLTNDPCEDTVLHVNLPATGSTGLLILAVAAIVAIAAGAELRRRGKIASVRGKFQH